MVVDLQKLQNEVKKLKEKKSKINLSKVDKILKGRLPSKDIVKKGPQATVVVNVPDNNLTRKMDRDKSRFFKQTWEEEKKRLFFR
jgi:hypothetical protein